RGVRTAGAQVRLADGGHQDVSDIKGELVQGEDEGVVVVAHVPGVVGEVAAAFRGIDLVEFPVPGPQSARAARRGDGYIEGAGAVEAARVLDADDELSDELIVDDSGIG